MQRLDPIGPVREDWRLALQTAQLMNVWISSKNERVQPEDVVLQLDDDFDEIDDDDDVLEEPSLNDLFLSAQMSAPRRKR